jgi:hypothetical protein
MWIAQQLYAETTTYIGFNYLAGVVLRGIVANDYLCRGVGLLERAVDGLTNIGPVVKAGDKYGDGGPGGKTLQGDGNELT